MHFRSRLYFNVWDWYSNFGFQQWSYICRFKCRLSMQPFYFPLIVEMHFNQKIGVKNEMECSICMVSVLHIANEWFNFMNYQFLCTYWKWLKTLKFCQFQPKIFMLGVVRRFIVMMTANTIAVHFTNKYQA